MKTPRERLALRLRKDRPWSPVTIKLPDDVIEELKDLAPIFGWENFLTLARTYIGEGLRRDLEKYQGSPLLELCENLRQQGLTPEQIIEAIEQSNMKVA